MKKEEIIDRLVDEAVSPNYYGQKADNERFSWRKVLRKRSKKSLLADLEEVEKVELEYLYR